MFDIDDFFEVAGAAVAGAAGAVIATTVILSSPFLIAASLIALGCCVAYALLTRDELIEFKNKPEVKNALEKKISSSLARGSIKTLTLSGRSIGDLRGEVTRIETTSDGKKCVTVEIKAAGHRANHTAKIGADEISDEIYVGATF